MGHASAPLEFKVNLKREGIGAKDGNVNIYAARYLERFLMLAQQINVFFWQNGVFVRMSGSYVQKVAQRRNGSFSHDRRKRIRTVQSGRSRARIHA